MKILRVAVTSLALFGAWLAYGEGRSSEAEHQDASKLHPPWDSREASIERGRLAFVHYCVLCHGATGEGNGRAARLYNPRPANLVTSDKNAAYKELIIRRGGAALGRSQYMPPWAEELTEEQITDVVNYLGTITAPRAAGN